MFPYSYAYLHNSELANFFLVVIIIMCYVPVVQSMSSDFEVVNLKMGNFWPTLQLEALVIIRAIVKTV